MPTTPAPDFHHVRYLWDDARAATLDPVGRLVYRSNLLGSDGRITNTGGGNTSSKLPETDPLTGQTVGVLWVKGSGGDLRTSKRENFSSLYQDQLHGLRDAYAARPDRGLKTPAEDGMVGMFGHATFNLNPRASSIDTPLHSFIPSRHVDHTHPNAVIAIAASADCERLTREIYGDEEVAYVPWMRPGFELGLAMQEIVRQHPRARGIMMGQHGLINWDDDDKTCYELSLRLIDQAARFIEERYAAKGGDAAAFGGQKHVPLPPEVRKKVFARLLPWLRGQVSSGGGRRFVGTVQDDENILRFVNSHDALRLAELGTSCPDHFLRTKIKPLFVAAPDAADDSTDFSDAGIAAIVAALKTRLTVGLEAYRRDYAAYYGRCRHLDSPAMRDPNPTVVLLPGLGMVAWGKDKSESRVTAEFYNCAVEVMRGAEAVSRYVALPQQEAFDIEYWLLEEAKLRRMPPEKELARKVVAVVGAGSGIGRDLALRLAKEGACVVSVDLHEKAAGETAALINEALGAGIGVAGSGISGCGVSVGLGADATRRESVRAMLDDATLAYGGLDALAVTAGIFVPPGKDGYLPEDKWGLTFAVNVTGAYLAADEAARLFKEQGLPAAVVLTSSANAVVPKKGSLAYDTSKAALNHLVRELAVEHAPLVRVNAVAPATVVEGSAMFPRERVLSSLTKYGIAHDLAAESDDELRGKLARFYADRTLTRAPITLRDQTEAFFLLLGDRTTKTTGHVFPVDGGLHEAFLR